VAGPCDHVSEPSDSIKKAGISWIAERLLASQEEVGSMELFSQLLLSLL
jgi:hypothetical protein